MRQNVPSPRENNPPCLFATGICAGTDLAGSSAKSLWLSLGLIPWESSVDSDAARDKECGTTPTSWSLFSRFFIRTKPSGSARHPADPHVRLGTETLSILRANARLRPLMGCIVHICLRWWGMDPCEGLRDEAFSKGFSRAWSLGGDGRQGSPRSLAELEGYKMPALAASRQAKAHPFSLALGAHHPLTYPKPNHRASHNRHSLPPATTKHPKCTSQP